MALGPTADTPTPQNESRHLLTLQYPFKPHTITTDRHTAKGSQALLELLQPLAEPLEDRGSYDDGDNSQHL